MAQSESAGTTTRSEVDQAFIDVHAHIAVFEALEPMRRLLPDQMPAIKKSDDGWVARWSTGASRPIEDGSVEVDTRLAAMSAQGITFQVFSCTTWLYLYDAPAQGAAAAMALQNDAFCELVRTHPNKFAAMAALPMQDPAAAAAEVRRVAACPEIAGVTIGTHVEGLNLDDPSFEVVWEALEQSDLPVLVHPNRVSNTAQERLNKYHFSNLLGNPFESAIAIGSIACSGIPARFPGLRFGFVHGGGFAPYQIGRWDHGWDVRPETREKIDKPPSEYFKQFYFDALLHSELSLRTLGELVGWDHVFLGTDYPWDMGTDHPVAELRALELDDRSLSAVANRAAHNFLKPGSLAGADLLA
jgi:aminocarboxymuconate-semialdehyde decarboxylase